MGSKMGSKNPGCFDAQFLSEWPSQPLAQMKPLQDEVARRQAGRPHDLDAEVCGAIPIQISLNQSHAAIIANFARHLLERRPTDEGQI